MKALFLVAAFTLINASPGLAQTCIKLLQNSVTPAVGPLRVQLSESERAQFKKQRDLFFQTSQYFARTSGREYFNLVRSRIPPFGRTAIVVAMGGAEHLGTLVEFGLAFNNVRNANVDFHYIEMTRAQMDPWYVRYWDHPEERYKIRTGIGPQPESKLLPTLNLKDPNRFERHFTPIAEARGLFKYDRIIVLDTGFRGTTVEALSYIAKSNGFAGVIEGVLLSHFNDVANTVPVFALKESHQQPNLLNTWAHTIDGNVGFGETELLAPADQTFYRSSRIADAPSELHDQHLIKYKSTLAGLLEGISSVQLNTSSRPSLFGRIIESR